MNTYVICDPEFSESVVILPHDVLSGDKGSFIAHMFGVYPTEYRTTAAALGALDALLKLTSQEKFQSLHMANATQAVMSACYDDEIVRHSSA